MQFSQKAFASQTRSKLFAVAAGLVGALMLTTRASAASPPTATGTVTAVSTGAQNTYALTLSDAASSPSPIGSIWEAWIPGQFYMTSAPTAIIAPTGWTENLTTGNGGYGIQYVASSAAFDVPAGGSLSGFSFTTPDAPSSIFGDSVFFPTVPTLTTVAYDAGLFSDAGTKFVFTPTAVPEPTTLAMLGTSGLLLLRRRRACN